MKVTTEAALGLIGGTFGLFTGTFIFISIIITFAIFRDGRVVPTKKVHIVKLNAIQALDCLGYWRINGDMMLLLDLWEDR